jgi:O-methyltransferase domain
VNGPNGAAGKVVQARLWNIISGPWKYCALLAFTQLEVADHLGDRPAETGELAARCHADPDALGRLLRCCASLGIVAATPAGRWALTVEGTALRAGGSMRAAVLANSGPPAWGAMLILSDAVRTGKPVFGPIAGKGFYDWHADQPEHGRIFQEFMVARSAAAAEVIAGLDFGSATVVADIGGGYGSVIAAVLEANPQLRGILLDRSDVLPGAAQWLAGRGLGGRCELVEGDYLNERDIPAADVYLLGSILHNHDDDEARLILGGLIAERTGARVICAEILLPDDPAVPHTGTDLDMSLLAIGGRERTHGQYTDLLGSAGLTVARVIPTASPLSVIDALHTHNREPTRQQGGQAVRM